MYVRRLTVAGLMLFTLLAPPMGIILSGVAVFSMYRQGSRGWEYKTAAVLLVVGVPWWILYALIGSNL